MDLITQTSLEALLLKATHSQNLNFDSAAVEAFCSLVNKERDGAHIGVKVIAGRLPTGNEHEILQTLNVLDTCMSKCGVYFQNEVGKFRFLNEMIKLVSPKYLGSHTPLTVKQKVLQLLYVWTLDYPKEAKIKEAFEMLRKQGVIKEIPNPNVAACEPVSVPRRKLTSSVFQDEEKSRILKKLLQSKDPEDIQAANWLIKSMVREDDKRAELKSKRISELESVQNNVRLLNEMLDSYKPGISSTGELDLINELYQNSERLKPIINKLALETHHSEGMLGDILETSDELLATFAKYHLIIHPRRDNAGSNLNSSLLNFDSSGIKLSEGCKENISEKKIEPKTSIDMLCDLFTVPNIPADGEVLQPTSVLKCDKTSVSDDEKQNKFQALEDLDFLSEHLLREHLQPTKQISFSRTNDKIPMNLLAKISDRNPGATSKDDPLNFDLYYLTKTNYEPDDKADLKIEALTMKDMTDDLLVDISDEKMLEVDKLCEKKRTEIKAEDKPLEIKEQTVTNSSEKNVKCDIKLHDISVRLEDIKPSSIPPMTVLDEKNGISITLHLAKDKPLEGVNVYVITTVSKNEMPLSNYLFQAVVPKGCKLKLQTPSSTSLPAFNPFLPPSAIIQIMLLANPDRVQICLMFIVSYIMDNDTFTEMGEVENMPFI